jgi:hypothetical protein
MLHFYPAVGAGLIGPDEVNKIETGLFKKMLSLPYDYSYKRIQCITGIMGRKVHELILLRLNKMGL